MERSAFGKKKKKKVTKKKVVKKKVTSSAGAKKKTVRKMSPAMRELAKRAERVRKQGRSYVTRSMFSGTDIVMIPTEAEPIERDVSYKEGSKQVTRAMPAYATPHAVWFKDSGEGMALYKTFKCTGEFDPDGDQGENYINFPRFGLLEKHVTDAYNDGYPYVCVTNYYKDGENTTDYCVCDVIPIEDGNELIAEYQEALEE